MATAKVIKSTHKRIIEQLVDCKEVTLTLTENEARFLRSVMEKIGGDPSDTPRRFSDAIGKALDDIGVELPSYAGRDACGVNNSIYYRSDYKFRLEELE